jgi:hypothetical protein
MNMGAKFKSESFEASYPIAMSLQQSLRTFQVTNSKVNDSFAMLIAAKKNEAQEISMQGLDTNWKNDSVVKTFA